MDWIFFDLGSTLIDESACLELRLRETLAGCDNELRDRFLLTLREGWAANGDGYKLALRTHDLQKAHWHGELERLYPAVPEILHLLKQKFRLGIIANQEASCRERLNLWGLTGLFDITILSCEVGASKPEPAIFLTALKRAGCAPEQAWMVGDRLDNDILPAMALGMKTVWVRQGWGGWGNAGLLPHPPTNTIDTIGQLLDVFHS